MLHFLAKSLRKVRMLQPGSPLDSLGPTSTVGSVKHLGLNLARTFLGWTEATGSQITHLLSWIHDTSCRIPNSNNVTPSIHPWFFSKKIRLRHPSRFFLAPALWLRHGLRPIHCSWRPSKSAVRRSLWPGIAWGCIHFTRVLDGVFKTVYLKSGLRLSKEVAQWKLLKKHGTYNLNAKLSKKLLKFLCDHPGELFGRSRCPKLLNAIVLYLLATIQASSKQT